MFERDGAYFSITSTVAIKVLISAITALLLATLPLSVWPAHATQLAFTLAPNNSGVSYQYQWQQGSINKTIEFTLDNAITNRLPISQPNYRSELANRSVTVALLKIAQAFDPKYAYIDVQQHGNDINVSVRARKQSIITEVQQQLRQAQQAAFNQYLSERYYMQYVTPLGQKAIKPDYLKYIQESTPALIPLSQAFYDQIADRSDVHEYLNLLLSWLQSIPYDTIEDRVTSNGSGFAPPLGLLNGNRGDCDSKAVLMASIMRALLPTAPLVLILLDDHAFLGVELKNPLPNAKTINIGGTIYTALEPTGPAQFRVGEIAASSAQKLASGHYTVEHVAPFETSGDVLK